MILPLLVAAGFILGCGWAGQRLGEGTRVRRRRALRLGAAALAWLLITGLAAATGVLNILVTYPPFVWLPGILVTAALMGHVLVWRWLSGRPAT